MNSRERILSAISGKDVDYTPLYCWCFGFSVPSHLRWKRDGIERKYWYTMRLEHIHTLPQEWDIFDDFERVKRWQSLGVDDVIDVSFPWDIHPDVRKKLWYEGDVMSCSYETPEGTILQKVRKTEEVIPPGWVIQPDEPKLFEDFNLPRSEKFPVSSKEDIKPLKYLLCPPSEEKMKEYKEKMGLVKKFSEENGVAVQGWSAFGMDGVVWLLGAQNAIILAMTEPEFFQELVETIYRFDLMRTERMIEVGGIDIIVQRGWYSSTDFWSPQIFRKYVFPNLKKLTDFVHQAGLKFGYVMTTGVMTLIDELIDAGVDLLYYADPQQENFDLSELKRKKEDKICVAGGISTTLVINREDELLIRQKVKEAMLKMGKRGFILSPVDALFPDTPYKSVEIMIDEWKKNR